MVFLRRQRPRRDAALAELRRGERVQDIAEHADPPPGDLFGAAVSRFRGCIAQAGQRLGGGLLQRFVLALPAISATSRPISRSSGEAADQRRSTASFHSLIS